MGKTSIEWVRGDDGSAGYTINPIRARNKETGAVGHFCEKVSPGCKHCYASAWNERVRPQPNGRPGIGTGLAFVAENRDKVEMFLDDAKLREVLGWKRPRRIFWCDMTDLFGAWVPDAWIDRGLAVMALTPQHTHILVTKRATRARKYFSDPDRAFAVRNECLRLDSERYDAQRATWPLRNVWLLVSAERQQEADERIPELLATPVAVHGVSLEPLLGPIDLTNIRISHRNTIDALRGWHDTGYDYGRKYLPRLDWLIAGGCSGPNADPCDVAWVRSIVQQGQAAGVATFTKQLGTANRCRHSSKGGCFDCFPPDLRVREFPQ
jgi:protein gp37